ncbi:hypothetical protein SXIM_12740 [Streptomyces xiamenensis]|uniref:Uncharacterized protein n=1 Tax=Streptomyces xiamenensis TaxID=408015 RepID=A0A0F7FR58_9ACTN|nr:hypothetical protein SXIM_12740 [Streptomyces xiamenensis]
MNRPLFIVRPAPSPRRWTPRTTHHEALPPTGGTGPGRSHGSGCRRVRTADIRLVRAALYR